LVTVELNGGVVVILVVAQVVEGITEPVVMVVARMIPTRTVWVATTE
jgi:hypothetical protein